MTLADARFPRKPRFSAQLEKEASGRLATRRTRVCARRSAAASPLFGWQGEGAAGSAEGACPLFAKDKSAHASTGGGGRLPLPPPLPHPTPPVGCSSSNLSALVCRGSARRRRSAWAGAEPPSPEKSQAASPRGRGIGASCPSGAAAEPWRSSRCPIQQGGARALARKGSL